MADILLTSPNFCKCGYIPKRNTARGEDYSPELSLSRIIKEALSLPTN